MRGRQRTGGEPWRAHDLRRSGFSAALLTRSVAQVIGKVAQTGAERIIGTVTGGTLGFLTYKVGRLYWDPDTRSDGVRLCITAPPHQAHAC